MLLNCNKIINKNNKILAKKFIKINSDWSFKLKCKIGIETMAKCDICGKSVQFGANVSHSNAKTSKIWRPNIKKVRVMENNRVTRKHVCVRCIKADKILKAV